jgi:hypothetical protein
MTTRRITPTDEEEDDSPAEEKWIHSAAKKSLRTDIITTRSRLPTPEHQQPTPTR